MRNKLKPILSGLALGFFLLIAMATDVRLLLDTSTNTTVKIKNCEERPSFMGTLKVTLTVVDTANRPIPGATGRLFIVHQKVRPDTCGFDVVLGIKTKFTTGPDGKYIYDGPDWIHDNSQDLFRIEVDWNRLPGQPAQAYPQPERQHLVKYYNESDFSFVAKQKPKL